MSGERIEEMFKGTGDSVFTSEHSSWRINILFFFLTASHVTLWPWAPVVLTTAGLNKTETGLAMSSLILMSVLGVVLALKCINKTSSGSVRRCFLFGTCLLGFFFGLTALVITPGTEQFCRQTPVYGAVGIQPNAARTANITMPHSHRITLPTLKPSLVTDEKHNPEYATEVVGAARITTQAPTIAVEHDSNSMALIPTEVPVPPDNPLSKKIEENRTNHIVNQTEDKRKELVPPQSDLINKTMLSNTPSATKEKQPPKGAFKNLTPSEQATAPNYSEVHTRKPPAIAVNNVVDKEEHTSPIDLSKSRKNLREFPVTQVPTETGVHRNLAPKSDSNLYKDPSLNKERVEPLVEGYSYDAFTNMYRAPYYDSLQSSGIPSIEEKPYDFREYRSPRDKFSSQYHSVPSPNKNRNAAYKVYGMDPARSGHKEYYDPYGDGAAYMKPIPYEPSETVRGLPAKRGKRSIDENLNGEVIVNIDKPSERTANSRETKILTESETIPETRSAPLAWGIFSLFLLATLIGGGTEVALSKLWHCSVHGVPHDRNSIDGIEATITSTFRLIFLGAHRPWTLITSALWIVIPTIFVAVSCQMEIPIYSPFRMFAMFFVISGVLQCLVLWMIPVPYGTISVLRSSRPLSLYLDDEVIQEGLRRIGFHLWVLVTGVFISLPNLYTMWLLQETGTSHIEVLIAQSASLIAVHFGESVANPAEKWIARKLNLQGVMSASGFLIVLQNIIAWSSHSIFVRSGSMVLVGFSTALVWISVKDNALLLGTSVDQEHESWISWGAWKIGFMIGASSWAITADSNWASSSVETLLPICATCAGVSTSIVLLMALFTRSKGRRRRRVYHTLDLHLLTDDDDSDESDILHEDDWLVRRAKKEGMKL